jgi:hypothetical protein
MFFKYFQNFNLFKYINIPIFIVSLLVGLFMVYVTMPDTRTIYVYPTPENIDILQYKDKSDSCFEVKSTEVTCPTNEKDITKIPVQS